MGSQNEEGKNKKMTGLLEEWESKRRREKEKK
jgi:hypothetical protein